MTYRRNLEIFEASRTNWLFEPSEQVMEDKERLRREYRKTWEAFSRHMKSVQELAGSSEAEAVARAIRDADCALAAHKGARDRLAALLAPELAGLLNPELTPWSAVAGQGWCRSGEEETVGAGARRA